MSSQMSKRYLLLGAGFSRNWGGWLASEVNEYLLGDPLLNDAVRNAIFLSMHKGGYENALANLRSNWLPSYKLSEEVTNLEDAILRMFEVMNRSYSAPGFEFESSNNTKDLMSRFLCRFDAIFTLNQDLLLEKHYFDQVELVSHDVGRKWVGCHWSGLQPIDSSNNSPVDGVWKPSTWDEKFADNCQPYVKLHGSSNWRTGDDGRLLIMGENKNAQINNQALLQKYHEYFEGCLNQPNSKLMVVGFGFGDEHIYKSIREAVTNSALKTFIVDPQGIGVLDKNKSMIGVGVYSQDQHFKTMWPGLIGASRRSIRDIIANDQVEREKIERFFERDTDRPQVL